MRFAVYRLTLPSGGTVRVRKLDRIVLLSKGLLCFPLLAAAIEENGKYDDERKPSAVLPFVTQLCDAALVDDGMTASLLNAADRMAVCHWAQEQSVVAPAVPDGWVEWQSMHFDPLVRSDASRTLDALCRRYSMRPSELAGIDDPEIAMDLDLALAYRGATYERQVQAGEQEIEVEDVYGNVHRLPANWFDDEERHDPSIRVRHADDFARQAARLGLTTAAINLGGGDGSLGLRGTQ